MQPRTLALHLGVLALPTVLVASVGCSGVELGGSSVSGSEPTASGGSGSDVSGTGDTSDRPSTETTGGGSASGTGGGHAFPPPGPPGGDICPGLACLPCGNGLQCATEGPNIGSTCCAEGDALLHRGEGFASEAVDVEVAGNLVFLCGGFGVRVNDVSDPDAVVYLGAASRRCQRIAVGRTTPSGGQVFYLAHHGDTWVETATLETFVVEPGETAPIELDRIEAEGVSFGGMAYVGERLYVAAHTGGLRVYNVADTVPVFESSVDGFDNATKVTSGNAVLYVADQTGGVRVLDVSDPADPAHAGQLDVAGLARDVAVSGETLAVSLGGDGVAVFDVSDPLAPQVRGHIDVAGSVQGVDIDDRIIAVAAWTHVAVYDRATLQLLATERVRPTPDFEQDFGVAIGGDYLHVAEWEGHHVLEYRPGLVAPDLAVDDELVSFPASEPGLKVVAIRNRGYLDLDIGEIRISETDPFTVDAQWGRIPPGGGLALEVGFVPDDMQQSFGQLALFSNDPDVRQQPHKVPLVASQTSGIDVGDKLTDDFGFLDPDGNGDVAGLQGSVVVLAYFALF